MFYFVSPLKQLKQFHLTAVLAARIYVKSQI